METKNWKEALLSMSRRIDEDRAFLQSYMLDPCLDNRPAEEERLKDIIALADEMEEILTDLIEKGGEAAVSLDTDGSDINIEYKTHTLGRPDGEDNIDGDWELSEEEMYPTGEDYSGDWGERHDEQLTDSTAQQTSGEPETEPEAAPQAAPYTELPLDAEGYPVE